MSDTIRVLLVRKFFEQDLNYIKSRLADNIELIDPGDYSAETLSHAVRDNIHAMLGEPPAKPVLENAKHLKLIQIPWTGVDRLDFDLLRKYDFTICNSHSNAIVVAEYAVSLMLALAKWIPYHDHKLRQGKWCRPSQTNKSLFHPPEPIFGKTSLIMGFGAIGKRVAKLLRSFDMQIQAVDAIKYSQPPDGVSVVVTIDQMYSVLKDADFVFLTIPLTEETCGLANSKFFESMKDSAYLVNVSRGSVMVEKDLYDALKDNKIAGAALDTWYNYPKPNNPDVLPSENYNFQELENIVMSPHRAGFAKGILPHLADAVENLNRFAQGEEFINVVNLERGY